MLDDNSTLKHSRSGKSIYQNSPQLGVYCYCGELNKWHSWQKMLWKKIAPKTHWNIVPAVEDIHKTTYKQLWIMKLLTILLASFCVAFMQSAHLTKKPDCSLHSFYIGLLSLPTITYSCYQETQKYTHFILTADSFRAF